MSFILLDVDYIVDKWRLLMIAGGYGNDAAFAEHLLSREEADQHLTKPERLVENVNVVVSAPTESGLDLNEFRYCKDDIGRSTSVQVLKTKKRAAAVPRRRGSATARRNSSQNKKLSSLKNVGVMAKSIDGHPSKKSRKSCSGKKLLLDSDVKSEIDKEGNGCAAIKREDPEPKSNKCPLCQKVLKKTYKLRQHMQKVHLGSKWPCEICGKLFSQRSGLQEHKKLHSDEDRPSFHCDHCDKVFISQAGLRLHRNVHTGNLAMCDICGAGFVSTNALAHHRLKHTGERPFACDQCEKSFTRQHSLMDHMRQHGGIDSRKKYACKFCGKEFIKQRLGDHENMHTGHKPFDCTNCGKKFLTKRCLKRHSVVHTGLRPYECKLCSKTFAAESSYYAHVKGHKMAANKSQIYEKERVHAGISLDVRL